MSFHLQYIHQKKKKRKRGGGEAEGWMDRKKGGREGEREGGRERERGEEGSGLLGSWMEGLTVARGRGFEYLDLGELK